MQTQSVKATEMNKRLPQKGDSIMVTYTTDGEGKIIGCQEFTEITAVYLDGSVRVGAGDVYSIAPSASGKATWMTVKPKKHH